MKKFTLNQTKEYCQYQVKVIVRWCKIFHKSEMDFVLSGQAKHFEVKHRTA